MGKKYLTILIVLAFAITTFFLSANLIFADNADKGFDEVGYNQTAGIFNGTYESWYKDKIGGSIEGTIYEPYRNDKLLMKWNSEWVRGNEESWSNPPYNAWEIQQCNGKVPGGSGEMWTYKFVWVGSDPAPEGGYKIWGQFAVIQSHGTVDNEHIWDVLAGPAGLGAYFQ